MLQVADNGVPLRLIGSHCQMSVEWLLRCAHGCIVQYVHRMYYRVRPPSSGKLMDGLNNGQTSSSGQASACQSLFSCLCSQYRKDNQVQAVPMFPGETPRQLVGHSSRRIAVPSWPRANALLPPSTTPKIFSSLPQRNTDDRHQFP